MAEAEKLKDDFLRGLRFTRHTRWCRLLRFLHIRKLRHCQCPSGLFERSRYAPGSEVPHD